MGRVEFEILSDETLGDRRTARVAFKLHGHESHYVDRADVEALRAKHAPKSRPRSTAFIPVSEEHEQTLKPRVGLSLRKTRSWRLVEKVIPGLPLDDDEMRKQLREYGRNLAKALKGAQ